MSLNLYNSLSRSVEAFAPGDPGHVTFYSCGPTVYDDAHIGNFRSFLAADVLRRFIESPMCEIGGLRGPRTVTHVMNITDVGHMTDDAEGGEAGEDRMQVAAERLLEAKKSGKLPAGATLDNPADPYQIASFYAARFLEDARTLGLKVAIEQQADPSLMPRPTQKIPGMIAMISALIAKGYAYAVGEAGKQTVYFDVQKFPSYGALSNNTLDNLRAGLGGRISEVNQQQKRHPADFLLWKADPTHVMKWPSPWGEGYPGWHIECSVMAAERLGKGLLANDTSVAQPIGTLPGNSAMIDLHSGGEDNMFPHHECEIAQSCCAFNQDPRGGSFSRHWFHPRHLFVDGAKMSKSKGNFYTPRDLYPKGVQPGALRLELIRTHYRTNANFTMQGLEDSSRMVDRWRKVLAADSGATVVASEDHPLLVAFGAAMSSDVNVAAAIAEVNKFVSQTAAYTPADAAAMRQIDAVLGVLALDQLAVTQTDLAVFVGGAVPNPAVEGKLHERKTARAAKDFARSDAIRDEILAMGYAIKDAAGGKVELSPRK